METTTAIKANARCRFKRTNMSMFVSLLIISVLSTSKLLAAQQIYTNVILIQEKRMMQAVYCKNQVIIEEHRYGLLSARNKVECAVQCRLDDRCLSVVYDQGKETCYLADSKAFENCTNMEPWDQAYDRGVFFYQEVAASRESTQQPVVTGTQQPAPFCGAGEMLDWMGYCVCAPGFAGTPCTRYFHDCADVYNYGAWKGDGVHAVKPLASLQSFQVLCRHITNTRTYIMQRKKKKNRENFNRPWADYKNGFGSLTGDFWIGLEKLHLITSARRSYRLRVNIKLTNNSIISYEYDGFRITNETSGYRLYFKTSDVKATNDCLLPLLSAPFSTYDHDQDGSENVNCAKSRKGGFWFRGLNCSTCNPHGIIYGKSTLKGVTDEAFCSSLGDVAPFKLYMYVVSDDNI